MFISSFLALSNFDPGSNPTINENVFFVTEFETIPPFAIIRSSNFFLDIFFNFPVITYICLFNRLDILLSVLFNNNPLFNILLIISRLLFFLKKLQIFNAATGPISLIYCLLYQDYFFS